MDGDPLRAFLGLSLRCWWCGRQKPLEELHELEGARLAGVECHFGEGVTAFYGPIKVCLECAIVFADLRARHDVEVFEDARS